MRISTTDPISMHDVPNPETHPFLIEGTGDAALKIYFENEDNKHAYEDLQVECPGKDFEHNLNNPA